MLRRRQDIYFNYNGISIVTVFIFKSYFFVCMCMYKGMHTTVHMWRSQDNFVDLVSLLFF